MLRFSPANVKIEALGKVPSLAKYLVKRKVYSFDLLSGHACPFAEKCFSRAVAGPDGKRHIEDGAKTEFRCFSASQEVLFSGVYKLRSANFEALKRLDYPAMTNLILENLPKNAGIIRIHVGGDFFNEKYFRAWMTVAMGRPDMLFYAYTKSLPYWVKHRDEIPENLVLTASRGGRCDDLISQHHLRESVVVFSEEQAAKLGLEIDHTDEHAANPTTKNQSFALLVHGQQPKGSKASEAVSVLKKKGAKFQYSRNKNANTV